MGRKLRISEGALTSKRYLEALKDAVEDHKEVMNIVQIILKFQGLFLGAVFV